MSAEKIILPGGAGLVGQNLVAHLKPRGFKNIVALDKHRANLDILRKMHPDIIAEYADLADPGAWEKHLEGANVVVMLQAQIGGLAPEPFARNNVLSTGNVLEAAQKYGSPYIVHISSSVVEAKAADYYTATKKAQEKLVTESGLDHIVLRPPLMFGWFDRKHLGWLARFMKKTPIFPIPGDGRYVRQPLYAGDFCRVIIGCMEKRSNNEALNITGLEKIDYIDIIRQIKKTIGARAALVNIPYTMFLWLLKTWALFDRDPPFTTDQLRALAANDEFEVIDWPGMFGVTPMPFAKAIDETFNDPVYGKIVLEF